MLRGWTIDLDPSLPGPHVSDQPQHGTEPDRFAYSGLLDAMPDAIVLVDPAGRIAEFNVRARVIFGYARAEVVGQSVELLLPERYRDGHVEDRERYGRSPHVRPMGTERDLVARHKDGREFPVEISLAPYQSPNGPLVVAVIRDTADRHRRHGSE
jgi:PAS domain S-box-containing protein